MKRPLVAVVSLYTVGLLLGETFQPPLVALFIASFVVGAIFFLFQRSRPFLLCGLLVFVSWINLVLHTAAISSNDLRQLAGSESEIVTVRGNLAETPSTRIFVRGDDEIFRSIAQVHVSALRRNGENNFHPATGIIVVTTPGILPGNFFNKQSVEITGVLVLPDLPKAEGLFNYRDYLKKLGIFYTLKTASTNDWQVGENPLKKIPFSDRFIAWATKTLTQGLDVSDESTQLLLAMTLGQKTALTDEVSEPFM